MLAERHVVAGQRFPAVRIHAARGDGEIIGERPLGFGATFADLAIDIGTAAPDVIMRGEALRVDGRVGIVRTAETVIVDRAARAPVEPQIYVLAADSGEQAIVLATATRGGPGSVETDLEALVRLPGDVEAVLVRRDVARVVLDDLVSETALVASIHRLAILDDLIDQDAA
ncbi:MAG TPA: hypothetical protein VN137_14245 [Sphingomonas sp.]|nr:hypothetical protein [Sphingomonas sp.]